VLFSLLTVCSVNIWSFIVETGITYVTTEDIELSFFETIIVIWTILSLPSFAFLCQLGFETDFGFYLRLQLVFYVARGVLRSLYCSWDDWSLYCSWDDWLKLVMDWRSCRRIDESRFTCSSWISTRKCPCHVLRNFPLFLWFFEILSSMWTVIDTSFFCWYMTSSELTVCRAS
jgi:hypothetical protein